MASILKRPDSRYWIACFTHRDGRRLKRSTGTTNQKDARRIADEYETAASKKRTLRAVRSVLAELHERISGESMATVTFRAHADGWHGEKKESTAKATSVFYEGVVKKFLAFLGERADSDIADIQRKDIAAFRAQEAAKLAAKTVNHELKTLRMIFKDARRQGLLLDDPCEFVDTMKSKVEAVRRPFSIDELKAVLAVCEGEWRSLVLFGAFTGQRLGDLARLTWSNLDTVNNVIRLTTSKTGKRLQIPMAAALSDHVATMDAPESNDTPIHPKAFAIVEKSGKTGGLSNQFADILAAAGLRKKKAHRKTGEGRGGNRDASGLSFHSLRHTAVTVLKEMGVADAVIMELIGHDSAEMSQHYTSVGGAALRQGMEKMPSLEKMGVAQ